MRHLHECERTATVRLGAREFDVAYTLKGKCYYDPGRISGPPENCYPPESDADLESVTVTGIWEDGEDMLGLPGVVAAIEAELGNLPLDEYLLESYLSQDSTDYGPDED